MDTTNTQTTRHAPATRRPGPPRIVRGPDGKPRVIRRGVAALEALGACIPKVLRIGVIHGSRIVEERIIRTRETVFVGPLVGNDFVVHDPGLPDRLPLFELRPDGKEQRYFLTFREGMRGRVAFPAGEGGVLDLDAIRASGRATPTKHGWQVPLGDGCRGKVSLGETTMLFQFVVPPPVTPRPQLPASVRGGWVGRFDRPIAASMGVALVVHLGLLLGTMLPQWPKPTLDEILSSDFAQIPVPMMQDDSIAPPSDPAEGDRQKAGTEAAKPAVDPRADPVPGDPAPATASALHDPGTPKPATAQPGVKVDGATISARRYEQEQLKIRESLSLVNIMGDGRTGPIGIQETIDGSSPTVGNLETALAQTTGVTDGRPVGSPLAVDPALSAGPNVGPVGTDPVAVVPPGGTPNMIDASGPGPGTAIVTGTVRTGQATPMASPGTMSGDIFRAALARKLPGVQQCYNNALPRDPTLAGDLTFSLAINMQGGVSVAVQSDSGSLAAAGVTDCIRRRLETLNFASNPPRGGDFRVRLPFTFIAP